MSDIVLTGGAAGASGRIILVFNDLYLYETSILHRTTASVPEVFATSWAENMIAQIESKFIPGWEAILTSQETFEDGLVAPAVAGYPDFVSDSYRSKQGLAKPQMLIKHHKRLSGAYDKMAESIAFLTTFGLDDFEQRIRDAEDTYRAGAALPLALTGDALEQVFGAAVRQWWFLFVSAKYEKYVWANDVRDGKWPPEHPFLREANHWDWARRHNNLCIQGGCFALQQLPLARIHEQLDMLLTDALAEEYLPPPDSSIRFTTSDAGLIIRTELAIRNP